MANMIKKFYCHMIIIHIILESNGQPDIYFYEFYYSVRDSKMNFKLDWIYSFRI